MTILGNRPRSDVTDYPPRLRFIALDHPRAPQQLGTAAQQAQTPLGPGTYTLAGCGPSLSGISTPSYGTKTTVTLTADEVDHVHLVWAYLPG